MVRAEDAALLDSSGNLTAVKPATNYLIRQKSCSRSNALFAAKDLLLVRRTERLVRVNAAAEEKMLVYAH